MIVAVVVDVLADLAALPIAGSVGRWLELEAQLLVPASEASVVLLGPRGRPRAVPSTLSEGIVRAAFAPTQPGRWLAQVMATIPTGPRPVARAIFYVDEPPPAEFVSLPVPGEDGASRGSTPELMLTQMINGARWSEGLAPLSRLRDLDEIARGHAESMRRTRQLAHDVGHGALPERLVAAGFVVRQAGENVARAGSVARAHRVLWESPSHRQTLLHEGYDALGLGIVGDEDGAMWVCEVFVEL